MKRLALAALFLSLHFGAGAPVWGQACATPAPTYTPTPGYRATLQAVAPGDLLVYYPLNETSGIVAEDDSGNNADGSYSGVTLNADTFLTGDAAGAWDGVNDHVDFYTAFLSTNLNPDEGTILVWIKVDASFWSDGLLRAIVQISVDASNRIQIRKIATDALRPQHIAGGTTRQIAVSSLGITDWLPIIWTWSASGNTIALYHDGLQDGTTLGPGAWAGGSLSNTDVILGAVNTTGGNPFPGNIAQVAIWDIALDATQAALISTVDPILPIPPTATLCPTYTPTPSPTWTATFTPTPSNTPNIRTYLTVVPPGSTSPGQDVLILHEVSLGSAITASLLFVIVVLLALEFARRLRRG